MTSTRHLDVRLRAPRLLPQRPRLAARAVSLLPAFVHAIGERPRSGRALGRLSAPLRGLPQPSRDLERSTRWLCEHSKRVVHGQFS